MYEAGQGEQKAGQNFCKRADAGKAAVNRILEKYTVYGVEAVYQCSHGKRRNHLDEIGEELEMYFDENPRKVFGCSSEPVQYLYKRAKKVIL